MMEIIIGKKNTTDRLKRVTMDKRMKENKCFLSKMNSLQHLNEIEYQILHRKR